MSKYQVKGLPWGSGLGKDVSDCKSAQDVMQKVGLDFTVKKCELVAKMPFSLNDNNDIDENAGDFSRDGMIYRDCPNAYATYRTDLNIPLGLVKSKYEVVQNMNVFNFFNDAIGSDANWDKAGMFGYGHKIFVSAKLSFDSELKNGDKLDYYLVFSNSHDGSSSIDILFSPIRVWCLNMLNSALKSSDNFIRLRHTANVSDKLDFGGKIVAAAREKAQGSVDLYNKLIDTKLDKVTMLATIAKVYLTDEELNNVLNIQHGLEKLFDFNDYVREQCNISTRKRNILTSVWDYHTKAETQQNIQDNAWGVYNAITGYYSNVVDMTREKRVNSLLYGTANDVMQKTLALVG
ncbi:MAG: DUF945 domain-containing protein [archaeon]|nr:DUF945 domain-containing protein [archaeon]